MENVKKFAALAVFVLLTLVLVKFIGWILIVAIWLAAGAVTWSLIKDWFSPAIERVYMVKEVRPKTTTTNRKPTSKKATKK